jgi:hypothetical protein
MRRTLFVVGRELARVMNTAATHDLIGPERRRLVGLVEGQGLAADGNTWIDRLGTAIEATLASREVASARELTTDVPELGLQLTFGEGKTWAGTMGISTRMLYLLGIEARIARVRPNGAWTSGQYRWGLMDRVVAGGLTVMDPTEARAELVRRYLGAYGPVSTTDVKWWTGWPLSKVRPALVDVGAIEQAVETGQDQTAPGWVLPGDADAEEGNEAGEPWVALLPGLDSTVMGWKERDWYLGIHSPRLFDRNGNAGPSVWVEGRMIGAWACADGGEIRLGILDDIGRERMEAVEAEAAALTSWLDGVRVTPRFRSPLDLELVPRARQ